jgi:hypothetical protein
LQKHGLIARWLLGVFFDMNEKVYTHPRWAQHSFHR